MAAVALWIAVVLVAAKLGGELALRLGQPPVLGEILAGIVLGNLGRLGITGFEPIRSDPGVAVLASLGVQLLLFEVGLGATTRDLLQVGPSSLSVAVVGVLTPLGLGYGVGAWLLPAASGYVHAFLGATLTATSVGITARVLKDLGRTESLEGRVILGAAVVDDVLGLLVLALIGAAISAADQGGQASIGPAAIGLLKAVAFVVLLPLIGVRLAPHLMTLAARLKAPGVLLALGLSWCFLMAWLADAAGLAPVVGAFAAGLVFEEAHVAPFKARGEPSLSELVQPVSSFLAPIFFVQMGARTELEALLRPEILALAAALTVAALLGKQASSLAVLDRRIDRLAVGIGMIPRGEVGLIFGDVGLGLAVRGERMIEGTTFSAVVLMVLVTTMATPPLLKWRFARLARKEASST
jgi:Kef-type K+ transport system membrane component KefB